MIIYFRCSSRRPSRSTSPMTREFVTSFSRSIISRLTSAAAAPPAEVLRTGLQGRRQLVRSPSSPGPCSGRGRASDFLVQLHADRSWKLQCNVHPGFRTIPARTPVYRRIRPAERSMVIKPLSTVQALPLGLAHVVCRKKLGASSRKTLAASRRPRFLRHYSHQ